MGILIDASILIEWESAAADIDERLAGREDERLFLSVITASELLHGVHRATTPLQRARRSAAVEGILDRFPLLTIDLPTARIHAETSAFLRQAGIAIEPHDLWVSASAIAHGLSVVTRNVRDFERVPGLQVERW